jgi:hypothetical protein
MRSLTIEGSAHPSFISALRLDDLSLCDAIVDFFDRREDKQTDGSVGLGQVDKSVKNSRDLIINPKELQGEDHAPLMAYMEQLHQCYLAYSKEWEFLGSILKRVHIGRFNIQRYGTDGHFGQLHSERTSLNTLHRVLVWMTYLNDVPGGGETEFPHFGLKVKPEKGTTLIWPAEWTHAHRGCVVTEGPKYIITGWMHFGAED